MKLLLEFLEEEPSDPFNRYAVAMEVLKVDAQQSIEHLEILMNEFSDYLPTYYQLAQLYFDKDELEKAAAVYEVGIALAKAQKNQKIEKELEGAYQMLKDEMEEW
ncbi:tetratricopeptide repeat protein [Arcticibacterium luteifluviistationis]|uniref:tetratricopeptide repeat protein n=1 Tax=Arcticibacterium luteifluviistationis TaxID=1784714 RepID=UPI0013A6BC74|nr:tetratricopeptide repeat protein [Arcticibacterium luteifluviistationis]